MNYWNGYNIYTKREKYIPTARKSDTPIDPLPSTLHVTATELEDQPNYFQLHKSSEVIILGNCVLKLYKSHDNYDRLELWNFLVSRLIIIIINSARDLKKYYIDFIVKIVFYIIL